MVRQTCVGAVYSGRPGTGGREPRSLRSFSYGSLKRDPYEEDEAVQAYGFSYGSLRGPYTPKEVEEAEEEEESFFKADAEGGGGGGKFIQS